MTEGQTIYRRCPDVRFRTILEEGVVVRIEAAEVLVVNGVGARILELVDGERSMTAIRDALRAEFEVEDAELCLDLEAFVAELAAAGILEPVMPAAAEGGP